MAKTKTPFFSFGSRGSVAESITTQKRGRDTVVRQLPLPTDPYTLPQAYQRWTYQDCAYLWTLQSAATRAQYRTLGVRYHLTGFQYWMKVCLLAFPNMLRWFRLDEKAGAIARDNSPLQQHATIFGATPANGLINGGFYFDGINDKVQGPFPTLLLGNEPFTLQLSFLFPAGFWPDATANLLFVGAEAANAGTYLWINGLTTIGYGWWAFGQSTLIPNVAARWVNIAVTYNGTNTLNFYHMGVLTDTKGLGGATPNLAAGALSLGNLPVGNRRFRGYIDDVYIEYGVQDAAIIYRRSQRRYPPQ